MRMSRRVSAGSKNVRGRKLRRVGGSGRLRDL